MGLLSLGSLSTILILLIVGIPAGFIAMNPQGAFEVFVSVADFISVTVVDIFKGGMAMVWWLFQALYRSIANLFIGAANLVIAKIDNFFNSFEFSLRVMKKYRATILGSFLILLLQWSLGVAIPYLFFLAVGYRNISFWTLSVAYPIYSLMDNIPIGIPANAGVLDIAMISTFVVLGIPKEIATLVTILTRSIIVIFEAILTGSISVIFLSRTFAHFSIRDLRKIVED